jgi:hypothetical protein
MLLTVNSPKRGLAVFALPLLGIEVALLQTLLYTLSVTKTLSWCLSVTMAMILSPWTFIVLLIYAVYLFAHSLPRS